MKNAVIALRTFFSLALPYFRSEERWRACGLLAGVVGSELFVVYVAVKMNEWNGAFFNAIEVRNGGEVRSALVVFIFITLGAILSGMGQFWFGQTLIIRWREWMTQRYVALWMADGRHYRIRFVDQSIDNIHLRIGNDVLLFIQRTHELGTGFLQSIVSLLSFAYILWGVSLIAPLPLFGVDLAFPGYLVVLAIGYAALGTVVAHFIGWPLIPLQFRQQRFESDFRFALARVTDHADAVALMGGEPVERAELRRRFIALVRNWVSLVNRQNGLNGFIFGYYHVSTVFPGADRHARLSGQRDSARCPDTGIAGFPEGRERICLLHHVLRQDRRVAGGDEPGRAIRGRHARGRPARFARCGDRHRACRRRRAVDPGSRAAAAERRADRRGARARSDGGRTPAGERPVRGRKVEPVPRPRRHLAAGRGAGAIARAARACLPCRSGRTFRSARCGRL